jgi:hypothetical protein
LTIVLASLGEQEATAPLLEFNKVFDPAGDPQKAFLGMVSSYPNFVAEEWSHVLTCKQNTLPPAERTRSMTA